MTLEQFAWLGAGMGGIGVMLSFVYFALELRHNTRAVRVASFQQVINSFSDVSLQLARDKGLVDLFVRAAKDYGSLGEVERTQYTYMMLTYLRRAESIFYQIQVHMLTDDQWSGIRNSITAVLEPPGTRACWEEMKSRFNPEFQNYIDKLIAK